MKNAELTLTRHSTPLHVYYKQVSVSCLRVIHAIYAIPGYVITYHAYHASN